jgi:hypothetical protein
MSPILEDDTLNTTATIPATDEFLEPTLKELNIDPSNISTPNLSSITQINEIATESVNHLKKHGRITMGLINFIKDDYSSSTNSTSSTCAGNAPILSSDKMSNAAPKHL